MSLQRSLQLPFINILTKHHNIIYSCRQNRTITHEHCINQVPIYFPGLTLNALCFFIFSHVRRQSIPFWTCSIHKGFFCTSRFGRGNENGCLPCILVNHREVEVWRTGQTVCVRSRFYEAITVNRLHVCHWLSSKTAVDAFFQHWF